ncbi:MAG: hypothetical protein P9L91_06600 [Candidatus Zophobacter franzmannii]|nr:hypothetical protein [Candidatus Zophobacter franzmannii]
MRKIYTLLCLLLLVGALSAQALDFQAPWYLQSFYDYYSDNYVGTTNAGRGYTGTSVMGNIENVLLNPAAFETDTFHMYYEFIAKMPAKEFNMYTDEDYTNKSAFGMIGISHQIANTLNVGLSLSSVKSLKYDRISVNLGQGMDILYRFPSMETKVLTATASYQWKELSFGLNIMSHMYIFKDYVVGGSVPLARNNFNEYAFRIQPGLYWKHDWVSLGASYMPRLDKEFEVNTNILYDSTLPAVANFGVSFYLNDFTIALEGTQEYCSQMDNNFGDRFNAKVGLELNQGFYAYRIGYMMRSAIWDGSYNPPSYVVNPEDEEYDLEEIYGYAVGEIGETEQHLITLGIGWGNDYFGVDAALIQDIAGNVDNTQGHGSIYLNLEPIFEVILKDR